MFTAPKEDEKDPRPLLIRMFTWGNFFAGSAALLVAIASPTTHTYLAYKDLADVREKELATRKTQYDKQSGLLASTQASVNTLSVQVKGRDESIIDYKTQVAVLNEKLKTKAVTADSELQKQLNEAIVRRMAAEAALEKGKPEIKRLNDQIDLLKQTASDRQDEIDRLSDEGHSKDEAIKSVTERLSKSR
jgi:chromosome segregation ATPase